jgi:hypothetical protein
MTQPQSRTARVISIAVAVLMEDHGLTLEQAKKRIAQTIDVLAGTGSNKLTPNEEDRLRDEIANGRPASALAKAYGVSTYTVHEVVSRGAAA